jgi:hypothetical protein
MYPKTTATVGLLALLAIKVPGFLVGQVEYKIKNEDIGKKEYGTL